MPTSMASTEFATLMALRLDVAHQIARHIRHSGANQITAARRLGIPQPTLSKSSIAGSRTLARTPAPIALRAHLVMTFVPDSS